MKKTAFVLLAMLVPSMAFAADAIPVIPDWINGLLQFIAAIPAVGPYIADTVKYTGILAGLLTLVSSLLIGVRAALAPLGKKMDWVDKVVGYIGVALPWIQLMSMFNVQKKNAAVEQKKK